MPPEQIKQKAKKGFALAQTLFLIALFGGCLVLTVLLLDYFAIYHK